MPSFSILAAALREGKLSYDEVLQFSFLPPSLLQRFACDCAERALHIITEMTRNSAVTLDSRCVEALQIKKGAIEGRASPSQIRRMDQIMARLAIEGAGVISSPLVLNDPWKGALSLEPSPWTSRALAIVECAMTEDPVQAALMEASTLLYLDPPSHNKTPSRGEVLSRHQNENQSQDLTPHNKNTSQEKSGEPEEQPQKKNGATPPITWATEHLAHLLEQLQLQRSSLYGLLKQRQQQLLRTTPAWRRETEARLFDAD